MILEGWEVKAIRDGRIQLKEAYVIIRNEALYLIGCHISPLKTASTHINPDPTRTRKLLPHAEQIKRLIGKVERAGYTLVHWICIIKRGELNWKLAWLKVRNSMTSANPRKKRNGNVPSNACCALNERSARPLAAMRVKETTCQSILDRN